MTAQEIIADVLRYFEGFERAARLRNHRGEYQHFEQCWEVVHGAFYGVFRLPHAPLPVRAPVRAQEMAPKGPRPQWQINQFSSPLMPVKSRDSIYETLQCGHRIVHLGNAPAKHRRCKKCPKEMPQKWKKRT